MKRPKTIRDVLGRDAIHPFPARMAPDVILSALQSAERALIRVALKPAEWEALNELADWPRDQWIKTRDLSGTRASRSSRTLLSLVDLGAVECRKHNAYNRQGQYRWRMTPKGRKVWREEKKARSK